MGRRVVGETLALSVQPSPTCRESKEVNAECVIARQKPADTQTSMIGEARPKRVRAWYGLPGEIVVEGPDWRLVKVGPLPLPHPPLINRFIRRGLPRQARLQLSYRHELGHLQMLPLALAHAVWLWRWRDRRPRTRTSRLLHVATVLMAPRGCLGT